MKNIAQLHNQLVFKRRVRVLVSWLCQCLPQNANVLDVGCGDGTIAMLIQQQRPDVSIRGIDVFTRKDTYIDVTLFNGQEIPFTDNSFNTVMFVDVLHHTNDPKVLLGEANRVASNKIVIKDHSKNGFLADETLRFMDWVGNAPHGVVLPYNYWTKSQWDVVFEDLNLCVDSWEARLNLYPFPANLLFDRSLHFIASLGVNQIKQNEAKTKT